MAETRRHETGVEKVAIWLFGAVILWLSTFLGAWLVRCLR